ncbi:hypothetical protein TNCV_3673531 [Trichonephila clavipes]|nr:hypothetical protein TNCV_3673531 [Trichonephila clavipes]
MRARNYYAHPNIRDHWSLRCMNRCPDLVICLKRDLQCLRPQASLVLIYRPNVAGMKGRVDLAQSVNRTQTCGVEAPLDPTRLKIKLNVGIFYSSLMNEGVQTLIFSCKLFRRKWLNMNISQVA